MQSPSPQQQLPDQSSKKWLIKYLLIGIFGGFFFSFICTFVFIAFVSFWVSLGGQNLGMAGFALAMMAFATVFPIGLITFFVLILFIGYRRHSVPLADKKSLLVELLFLLFGAGVGSRVIGTAFVAYQDLGFMPMLYLNDDLGWGISTLVFVLSGCFGAYFFFKISQLLIGKTDFKSLLKQPLIWIALITLLLATPAILKNQIKSQEMAREINSLRLSNIQVQDAIVLDKSPSGFYNYKITASGVLTPSPRTESYWMYANLDAEQNGCPHLSFNTIIDEKILPGAKQIKLDFEGNGREKVPLDNSPCAYNLSYWFEFKGEKAEGYRGYQQPSEGFSETMIVVWKELPPNEPSASPTLTPIPAAME